MSSPANAELLAEVRRIEELAGELGIINALAGRLEAAGAAMLAKRVRSQPLLAAGDDATLPVAWREAWN